MQLLRFAGTILGITLLGVSGPSYAQKQDFGKSEYVGQCAVCHGERGKGNGPKAGSLATRVADLTTLARRNAGVFPFQRVYEVIDGRQAFKAHGPRDMPIWGARYLSIAGEDLLPDPEAFVRTRILAVTEYIYRLQVK
jgi:mono/diheme cytochrome c family protein